MTGRRRSSGEGSVYRRASDGLWVGLADLGRKKGKRRRKAVYGRTEREVRCKLAEIRRSAQRGVDVFAHRRTVEQWLTEWVSDIKTSNGTRASTLLSYRWLIAGQIRHRTSRPSTRRWPRRPAGSRRVRPAALVPSSAPRPC